MAPKCGTEIGARNRNFHGIQSLRVKCAVWVNKTLMGANRRVVKDRVIKNDKILEAGQRS